MEFEFHEAKEHKLSRHIAEFRAFVFMRDLHLLSYPAPYRKQMDAWLSETATEKQQQAARGDHEARDLLNPEIDIERKGLILANHVKHIGRRLLTWYGVSNPDIWRTYILHKHTGPEHFGDVKYEDENGRLIVPEVLLPTEEEWGQIFKHDGWRVSVQ